MLFESVSLRGQISAIGLILIASNTKSFNFTANDEELVFFLFKTELCISELNWNVSVSSFLEIDFLS